MTSFSSDILLPFPNSNDLNSRGAMVDSYNQNMGGVDSSDQVMYSYAFETKSKSWSKKVTHFLMNSYILYKLTAGHPKTRLEFIKDVRLTGL